MSSRYSPSHSFLALLLAALFCATPHTIWATPRLERAYSLPELSQAKLIVEGVVSEVEGGLLHVQVSNIWKGKYQLLKPALRKWMPTGSPITCLRVAPPAYRS